MGRGKSKVDVIGAEAAAQELFDKIRVDSGGDSFDAAEAAVVIVKLERADLEVLERQGNTFHVTIRVLGGFEAIHVLKMPSQQQILEYDRSSTSRITSRRAQEIRTFLEPSGALYDKLIVSASGYAGKVPIVHKAAVVNEIILEMNEGRGEEDAVPE